MPSFFDFIQHARRHVHIIRRFTYLSLSFSLFLPSIADEVTNGGETVTLWEPSYAIHFHILFAPIIEVADYSASLRTLEEWHYDEERTRIIIVYFIGCP